jgi:2,3-bisphosphoglycerate-independent phosphoglycerate mutase
MPPPRKIIFVMIDGIADVAIPTYHHKTPLQHAHTPRMDALAGK